MPTYPHPLTRYINTNYSCNNGEMFAGMSCHAVSKGQNISHMSLKPIIFWALEYYTYVIYTQITKELTCNLKLIITWMYLYVHST